MKKEQVESESSMVKKGIYKGSVTLFVIESIYYTVCCVFMVLEDCRITWSNLPIASIIPSKRS